MLKGDTTTTTEIIEKQLAVATRKTRLKEMFPGQATTKMNPDRNKQSAFQGEHQVQKCGDKRTWQVGGCAI